MLDRSTRWLIMGDILTLLDIEKNLANRWKKEYFCHFICDRKKIGTVIERDGR